MSSYNPPAFSFPPLVSFFLFLIFDILVACALPFVCRGCEGKKNLRADWWRRY